MTRRRGEAFISPPHPGTVYRDAEAVVEMLRKELATAVQLERWNTANTLGVAIWLLENRPVVTCLDTSVVDTRQEAS